MREGDLCGPPLRASVVSLLVQQKSFECRLSVERWKRSCN